MDGETHRQTIAIKPVRGERLFRGRELERGGIEALFAKLDGAKPGDARDGVLLALLYGCGLRRAEVAGLTTTDVDPEKGTPRVRGKGNRERIAHMNRGTRAAIDNWMTHSGTRTRPFPAAGPRPRAGSLQRRFSAGGIRLRLQRRAAAGIAHCSPHDLRPRYVSTLLEHGNDMSTVANMAGHRNVQTTSRCDRRGERAPRAAAETRKTRETFA